MAPSPASRSGRSAADGRHAREHAPDCKSADALAADLPLLANFSNCAHRPVLEQTLPGAVASHSTNDDTTELRTSIDLESRPRSPGHGLLLTSLHTSISAKGSPTMTTHEPVTTAESVTYKRFCSPAAIHGQSQLEISGFGVRVPGGAQKPRSQRWPGFLHTPSSTFTTPFAASSHLAARPTAARQHSRNRSDDGSAPTLIVTVRHITPFRIASTFSDSRPRPALSRYQLPTLEA